MTPQAALLAAMLAAMGSGAAQPELATVTSAAKRTVYVVPVEGTVEPAMAAFLGRAIRLAAQTPDALLVLEMDTFGGGVEAAFQIVDTLLAAPVPTIAYVKTKAISAGALIALACNRLVMRPNTTIGDCAPISVTNEGPQMLGEKFQSPLRAKFRTLAKKNGFPELLAESMVSSDRTVYQVKMADTTLFLDSAALADLPAAQRSRVTGKTAVVKRGELLTMDDVEAKALGFSKMSASSVEEMLPRLGIASYEIKRVESSWSEDFVRLISAIAPILMILGFGALYLEFKMPGHMVFAVIGIVLLGLVFFGQYLVGLANYTEFLLILLGVALVVVELFVFPGTLIAGITAIALIAIALVLSLQDFVIPTPSAPWQAHELSANLLKVFGSALIAAIISFFSFRLLLPRLGMVVQGPYLNATLQTSHADSFEIKNVKPGDNGTALTLLRPAGKARFGGDLHDVVTEGDFIERGASITVREVTGNKIVVMRRTDGK